MKIKPQQLVCYKYCTYPGCLLFLLSSLRLLEFRSSSVLDDRGNSGTSEILVPAQTKGRGTAMHWLFHISKSVCVLVYAQRKKILCECEMCACFSTRLLSFSVLATNDRHFVRASIVHVVMSHLATKQYQSQFWLRLGCPYCN